MQLISCPTIVIFFFSMAPITNISDLVRDVKTGLTNFIYNNRLIPSHFEWQKGFGAFLYSHSHIDNVVKYVLNQEEHHQTFKEEYLDLFEKFNIEYDSKYLFEFYDDIE